MKYQTKVKYNGAYYEAGADVPIAEDATKAKEDATKAAEKVKK